jgi:thiamine biosynthesis lipoprotein
VWRGHALGAEGVLTLYVDDPDGAARLIDRVVREIRRLEGIFSLYQPNSALSLLNRFGRLDAPPSDLIRVLAEARRYSEASGGAFDVTVQPLWNLYAAHFARPGADPNGPLPSDLERALDLVDYQGIRFDEQHVALQRPEMAVTLNGIAQGYITDRVTDLLKDAGLKSVLVELGETRATGVHPDGRPWRIGIRNPEVPESLSRVIELSDAAIATSAGMGTAFEDTGRHHHLFDPGSGLSAARYLSVSVRAATATAADALSTTLSALHPERIREAIAVAGDVDVLAVSRDRQLIQETA